MKQADKRKDESPLDEKDIQPLPEPVKTNVKKHKIASKSNPTPPSGSPDPPPENNVPKTGKKNMLKNQHPVKCTYLK